LAIWNLKNSHSQDKSKNVFLDLHGCLDGKGALKNYLEDNGLDNLLLHWKQMSVDAH